MNILARRSGPARRLRLAVAGARRQVDIALAGLVASELRRGSLSAEGAARALERAGFHLLRKHYFLPIPDLEELPAGFWERRSELVGIDLAEDRALRLLTDVFPPYVQEFRSRFPDERSEGKPFYLLNGTFMAVDAHVLYALIRHARPRRVLELGAGMSTLVAAAALDAGGGAGRLTSVAPFPPAGLLDGGGGRTELVRSRAEDLPLSDYTSLGRDDVLFIDSTHVLRAGGDVQFLYLEVLPRLAPGVLVHVHDVSLPREYPRTYAEQGLFWSEQYVLQAYLAFNRRVEVVWPGNALLLRHPDAMQRAFPEIERMRAAYPSSEPTSFWFRVRGADA